MFGASARLSPEEFAARMLRAAETLEQNLVAAETATLQDALRIAVSLSSGPYSLSALAAMGHPYARRAPNPPMLPGVINVQSGRFRDSWYTIDPQSQDGIIVGRLPNSSPEAAYLAGTKLMIERPVVPLIAEQVRPIRRRRVRDALRKSLRGE